LLRSNKKKCKTYVDGHAFANQRKILLFLGANLNISLLISTFLLKIEINSSKKGKDIGMSLNLKGSNEMRNSEKGELTHTRHDVFGMDFHDLMVKEQNDTSLELASEFGISLREVKNLKKHLNRS
jgi:hypothetical protein